MVTPRCPENAMARPLVRDEEGVSTLVSLIGVLILVIAILAVYFGFLVPKFAGPPLRAGAPDDGRVRLLGDLQGPRRLRREHDRSVLGLARDRERVGFRRHGHEQSDAGPNRPSVRRVGGPRGFD